MSNYDNNNRAAIWGNDKREKDTQPEFKGKATIDGVEYYVSAWKRKPDANPNAPALSMSFAKVSDVQNQAIGQAQQTMQQAPQQAPKAPPQFDEFEDSNIPF